MNFTPNTEGINLARLYKSKIGKVKRKLAAFEVWNAINKL
jgi:hypothetical protein